jgi:YVTN family beta-propeller protein
VIDLDQCILPLFRFARAKNSNQFLFSLTAIREDAMKLRFYGPLMIAASAVSCFLGSAQSVAQNAYIPNGLSNDVSVINTTSNTVTATIPVGLEPWGVAVSPDGSKVYITNENSNFVPGTVSVIDTATNMVTATIPVGQAPEGIAVTPDGRKVYVANISSNTVSVIDTATNTVTAAIPVSNFPIGVAASPDGSKVYITSLDTAPSVSGTVSVIDTATNTVMATISIASGEPEGVAITPDGRKIYTANSNYSVAPSGTVSVIDTVTNRVTATIPVGPLPPGSGSAPFGVAVAPSGSKVYVTNDGAGTVSVIDTVTNTVTATIPVGSPFPSGVAVSPDGSKVYVANWTAPGTVSVIDTASNAVTATIPVGNLPIAIGVFIQPLKPTPRFAGTPGKANCYGQSVSALVMQYHGLNAAAAALGFSSITTLEKAILTFCEG